MTVPEFTVEERRALAATLRWALTKHERECVARAQNDLPTLMHAGQMTEAAIYEVVNEIETVVGQMIGRAVSSATDTLLEALRAGRQPA